MICDCSAGGVAQINHWGCGCITMSQIFFTIEQEIRVRIEMGHIHSVVQWGGAQGPGHRIRNGSPVDDGIT